MGRMTHGILYGVSVADGGRWIGEDGDSGIIGEYKACRRPDIEAAARRLGLSPWNIERRFVPDTEYVDDERCRFVGFWITIGGSECGMSGSVEMSRAGVKAKWPREFKNARVRWRRFARWCAANNIDIDRARLWLLETEVT